MSSKKITVKDVEKLSIKDGDVVVLKGKFEPSVLMNFQNMLRNMGFTRVGLIVLAGDKSVHTMDEESMRQIGWQRIEESSDESMRD